ncbi:hypothetical protein AVDCRST_MAG81-5397 [uncultured Synechococcales cyanobacterium]|uniref:Uncharacterized protein n=1 Tax=uncultured Synechococcales cyanobacterium TaxID=1936017 RepID=A0A6J4VY98_9CYAN|nr:hypothetical protein AVDCRST_MAG81-5397 [uncultured Synechococcales cyanobacterium]
MDNLTVPILPLSNLTRGLSRRSCAGMVYSSDLSKLFNLGKIGSLNCVENFTG